MSQVELIQSYLSFLRPRPEFTVDGVRKIGRGYIIDGTNNAPPAKVVAYVDDCVYVEETKYPRAIRYKMRMGDTIAEPTFYATIDFEGMWIGSPKKQVIVTVYLGFDSKTIDIPFDANINMEIRKFFAEEISRHSSYYSDGLSIPYKRMLDFLEKRLEKSMKWINGKQSGTIEEIEEETRKWRQKYLEDESRIK